MPLSRSEFSQLLPNLNLTEDGKSYVAAVRSSPPSRRVQANVLSNCRYRYVSKRMSFAVMAESHLEYRFILGCEYDFERVVEYWDQPTAVEIHGINKSGRPFRSAYTADFIAIYLDRVVAYEVKPHSECLELVAKRPEDWRKIDTGFEYRPAKEAFDLLGIRHVVVTDLDIDPIRSGNYELLIRARATPSASNQQEIKDKSTRLLIKEGAMSLRGVLNHIHCEDATPLIKLIDSGTLCAKAKLHRFFDVDETWVALDEVTLDSALEAKSLLEPDVNNDERISTSVAPSGPQLLEVNHRLRQLRGITKPDVSPRTLRRWRRWSRNGSKVDALISQKYRRGNRIPRISQKHETLLQATLRATYLTPKNWTPYRCYGAYCRKLASISKRDPSNPSLSRCITFRAFLKRVRTLDPEVVARARGGKRAANAAAAPTSPTKRQMLATRPFQRAHVDHALLDIHLKVMESGGRALTSRAWLTAMVDEYSGAVLAMSLSFRSPSKRSCALVIRDCVRRHGRLPETNVVDNGSEFESVYFEACLARLGINIQSRPPGHPRYGSSVERIFGILNDELVLTLPGNTRNITTDRGKSSSHKGQACAKLTFLELHELLNHYFFEIHNHHASGNRLLSPIASMRDGLRLFSLSGIQSKFDYAFLVTTAIECRPIKLDAQRGLRHNGWFYVHPILRTIPHRSQIEIREEPWDKSCIYALVNDEWVQCFHGPKQGKTTFTAAMICSSMLWLDAASVRAQAKLRRLIAADETNEKARRLVERGSLSVNSLMPQPSEVAIALPAALANITPLNKQQWEES